MKTLSPTFTRVQTIACAACHDDVPVSEAWDHYRGQSNSPLCAHCAMHDQVSCSVCGDPSPRRLMLQPRGGLALVCPCVHLASFEVRLPAPGSAPHPADACWEFFLEDERLP